jgi:hypothetical protein
MKSAESKGDHSNEQAKRDGGYVRAGMQQLQGVALLQFSRNTNHTMYLAHFKSAQKVYQLTGNNGKK